MEKITTNLPVAVRIILAGFLAALLGLSAGELVIQQDLRLAYQAQANKEPLVAASHFKSLAEREPWRSELWLLVGRNAWEGSDAQATIEALAKPELDELLTAQDHLILGDAYLAVGESAHAVKSWEEALNSGAAPGQVLQRLLDLHIVQGDYEAQVEDLKNMLKLEPANSEIFMRLGQIISTIDPASALAYLSQAQVLDPALAEKAGDLRDAIRTAQLASDPAFPFLQAGRILAIQGEWTLAQRAFLRAIEINPGMAEAWAYLGEAYYQVDHEDLAGSRRALDQAAKLDPESLPANAFMALYWERQGTLAQAMPYLKQAARLEPDNPLWPVALGQLTAVLGDLPQARVYYEQAIALEPAEAEYYRLLAEFYIRYQIQVKEGALPAARKALSLEPDDALNLDVLGQALLLSGDRETAVVYFERAIERSPEYAPALLHLGVVYLEQGKSNEAYPLIEKARSLDPDSATSEQAGRLLEYFFP